MTVNRTTLLDLPLPVTGTESGTWGDTTNNGLTQYVDIAIAGMSNLTSANFTTGALTIETTEGNSSATNITATSGQYAGFRVTSLAQNSTITVGNTGTSPARSYRLINADATYTLTFKATGQTGITLQPGQTAVVAFNGTDYVIVGMAGAGTVTDNAVVRFDGTTGKLVQNSVVTIADSTGDIAGAGSITSTSASGILTRAAATQDGVELIGRAGGSSSYKVTLTPATLGGNRTLTLPDTTGTVALTGSTVASFSAGSTGFTPNSATTGAVTLAGTLATTNGGTGLTSFTANGVVYASSSSALTTGSALTWNGSVFSASGTLSGYALQALPTSGAATLNLIDPNNRTLQILSPDPSGNQAKIQTTTNHEIIFGVNSAEKMRLASATGGVGALGIGYTNLTSVGDSGLAVLGNVGIGTSSPGAKLEVFNSAVNGAFVPNTLSTWRVAQIRNDQSVTSGSAAGIAFVGKSDTQPAGIVAINGNTTGGVVGLGFLTVASNTTSESMRLDSSGNLGLGVTPNSGWTDFTVFQNENAAILGYDAGQAHYTLNTYYQSGTWKYIGTSNAARYTQIVGQHQWFTAASGTAGNTITWTQAMTLDASGNLQLATTTPVYTSANRGNMTIGGSAGSILVLGTGSTTGGYVFFEQSTGGMELWNGANSYIRFGTNGTERARITSGGYFKASNDGTYVNSAGAFHELRSTTASNFAAQVVHADATDAVGLRIYYSGYSPNGTGNQFLFCEDSTAQRASIRSNGGLANYSANNVNLASDERLKKDIAPLSSTWGKVKDIEVVNFRYKDCNEGDPALYGVIAQQVQPIVPELVVVTREATETDPEYYGIREQPMYWLAIKALQEAMARIETLEAKVAQLEGA